MKANPSKLDSLIKVEILTFSRFRIVGTGIVDIIFANVLSINSKMIINCMESTWSCNIFL